MPELPDIELYLHCLRSRVEGRRLERVRIASPSLLRSVQPSVEAAEHMMVCGLERLGKRIVIALEGSVFLVMHLMISGRLRWSSERGGAKRITSAELVFESGTLTLTEASTQKRATLHVILGRAALAALDPGGIEPLTCDAVTFAALLRRENRTLKRALTDPRAIAGIGNAYSDEILHAARLSPLRLTSQLSDDECAALIAATQRTLTEWTRRLIEEFRSTFPGPGDVTAFRPDFAVHGKFGQPCPACGTIVQRIVRGDHETNYCPRCQTGGKVLADRSLSRLLKDDWPATVEEWEAERQ